MKTDESELIRAVGRIFCFLGATGFIGQYLGHFLGSNQNEFTFSALMISFLLMFVGSVIGWLDFDAFK